MANNKATDTMTYEDFLVWHAEATARLQEGEELAAPSQKFFEHWRSVRLQAAIQRAMADGSVAETAILVDLREAWPAEQRKANRRTFAEIEQALRDVYAGGEPLFGGAGIG